MQPVCVAFKAHQGWAAAVAVACGAVEPLPVAGYRVELVDLGNREIAEPYHVAGGWQGLEQVPPPADPHAIIARAELAQQAGAVEALGVLRAQLAEAGWDWQRAVVCTRRGIVHELADTLSSHAHIHIAEADAIRAALRHGLDALVIETIGQDEKSVPESLAAALGTSAGALDAQLKARKPDVFQTWRKEDRMLAMAAALHSAI